MKNSVFIPSPKSLSRSFTLIELIVVIIIVGILAALGISQYSKMVEKGRSTEAKIVLGSLRSAEIANYFENGAYAVVGALGVAAPTACVSTHYFSYYCNWTNGTCGAYRCTTGGKTPTATADYSIFIYPDGHWDKGGAAP